MYVDNKKDEYEATKIIKYSANNRTYISVPKWLIGKTLQITIVNSDITKYKKVNSNSQISFPEMLAGQRVQVKLSQ